MKETKDLIIVTQLPIIEQTLKQIGAKADLMIKEALALEINGDNKKEIQESKVKVKNARADLKKQFEDLETRRKAVKNEVLKPYNDMEETYKKEITDRFIPADEKLKTKIDAIENTEKENIKQEITDYFNEYRDSKNINFIEFIDANINITLSASIVSLKEQAKVFIDKIANDLELIEEEEHKAEILVEYKKTLNASASILEVKRRVKAIEEEKARQAKLLEQKQKAAESVAKVEEVVSVTAPIVEEPKVAENNIIPRVKIVLINETIERIKELQKFLKDGGYNLEQNN